MLKTVCWSLLEVVYWSKWVGVNGEYIEESVLEGMSLNEYIGR